MLAEMDGSKRSPSSAYFIFLIVHNVNYISMKHISMKTVKKPWTTPSPIARIISVLHGLIKRIATSESVNTFIKPNENSCLVHDGVEGLVPGDAVLLSICGFQ